MFVKNLKDCQKFTAGDGCTLRELLHPDKGDFKLRYSFAHAIVSPGMTTKAHVLTTSEVYYILEGIGVMHIDNETSEVSPGDLIYIPPDSKQYIKNTGTTDLIFICIVDPAWRIEDETIFK